MEFNFSEFIAEPTEIKTPPPVIQPDPPGSNPQTDPYYQDDPPETAPIIQHPASKRADPAFSAEMAVSSIDALQYVLFMLAHKKKLKGIYFSSQEEYLHAQEFTRKMPAEIEKLEDAELARALIAKYNVYIKKLEARTANLAFSQEEEMLMRKPIEKMIQRNPNFDIPPGMALVLAALVIASPRLIDLTQE